VRVALDQVAREIDRHAAARGWDQPPRLYALADTGELVRREPALAAQFGLAGGGPSRTPESGLTPVEQDALPTDRPLDDVLATISWPPEVLGCALVIESLVLPPTAEADMPDPHEVDIAAWVAGHPDRVDVRITVAVLRDGSRECVVRLRDHDTDESLLAGADLVPGLADALVTTLD
jgi:hypothetical protein